MNVKQNNNNKKNNLKKPEAILVLVTSINLRNNVCCTPVAVDFAGDSTQMNYPYVTCEM